MNLFGLILDYLDTYIFAPINGWFVNNSYSGFDPSAYYLYFDDGKFNIYSVTSYEKELDLQQTVDVYGINLMDLILFITTVVIFILLFIVAVKFIVWLFKQISFITRY